jgi:ABC-type branched-subunit amino acid transport system ATPase component
VCGEIVERLSEALPETKSRFALWAARRGAMSAFEIAQRGFIIETGFVRLRGKTQAFAQDPAIRQAYPGLVIRRQP